MKKIKIIGNINSATGVIIFYDKSFIENKIKEAKKKVDYMVWTGGDMSMAESECFYWQNLLNNTEGLKMA